jgi:NAD(P)-dependent dehydrogenase (short-subunit alcohol dehydrogenase family)
MPNFHALTSALTFPDTNVVVVGGTQGIGAGIAVRFAELGASVLIVGRKETLGSEMIKTLESASQKDGGKTAGVRFGFVRRDLGSVEEIKAAAEDIAQWAGDRGVHYLVQSQGGVSNGFLGLTAQSLTTFFNVQILSHFLIPYLLLSRPDPVLRKGAQICNIARPGEKNRNIDLDDFICLKALEAGTFSILKDAMRFVFMMDLFTEEFNIKFPDTHTTHVYPGAVSTAMFEHPTVPWYFRVFARVAFFFFGRSPAQYANVAVWEIASEEARKLIRAFWDQYGREVDVDERVKADSQLRQRVWENLLHLGGVS